MSRKQWVGLADMFIAGSTARVAAELAGVNRNTAIKFFHKCREVIAREIEKENPFFDGEIEIDESYFGGVRKGKRGRGAAGKVPVFGLLKRNGKVYTQIIPNAKKATLMPIIEQHVQPDSVVYTDSLRSYNSLDVSGFRHKRVNHSKRFVTDNRRNHINGIENFWNQAKRHLRKFNGIPKDHFYLYLKECEWRFNVRNISTLRKQLHHWLKLYFRLP